MSFMGDQDLGDIQNRRQRSDDYDTSWSTHAKTVWIGALFLLGAIIATVFVR